MLNLKGVVKPNRLSEPGLLFFFLICAYPTPSELKPWAWQPSLTTFIYEATRMCYIPHLPAAHFSTCDYAALWMSLLGTLCRPALARGCCQRNAIEGVCCLSPQLSEMCSITTYSHQVLNSPPSLILHRCSRRKLFFFFFCFKWTSRAWHNTVQRNAQVSTVQKLVMSSLPPLSSFSTSQKINMGTIMFAQGLKKKPTRKCAGDRLTGNFSRLLYAEL